MILPQATEFLDPLVNLWNSIVLVIPGVIVALIIGIIGYLIAYVIGHAIRVVLGKTKLDSMVEKTETSKTIGKIKISGLLGDLTKWYIFIIFLQAAVAALNLGTISDILGQFVSWLPDVIAAVLVVIFGLIFSQFVSQRITAHAHTQGLRVAADVTRWIIIVIAVVIAMGQIGINTSLLENLVLLIVGAVAVGTALAIGLSFGLGNKKEANDFVRKMQKKM